ncbi:response regulator [Paenibacillus sp. PAMC21692]|uniref:response regulator n=1 Tax=Paenibacillus sp. PAMC21692 TaxID=2762320 RepID=UPI00164E9725|nr:response regulator [Paenibacillus sp. PAMC21692]QNK57787.1 response regulator [Paenibacillus sp. PAMC21692]
MTNTNVLIVDDEMLVRLSLKTLIPWSEHGFHIIGEAQNGVEALEILEREDCHIVLTDIRMPDMDGLELISRIRGSWPMAKCVILSNHNDFEYVQQALRLGAVDYLLKLAWVPEELLEKCKRLQQEVREEEEALAEQHRAAFRMHRLDREAKEALLRSLLTKHTTRLELENATTDAEFEFSARRYRTAVVAVDRYEHVIEENRFRSEQLLAYTVANVLNEILRKYGGGELIEVSGGTFAIVSSEIGGEMLQHMREATGAYAKISISCGVSRTYNDLSELYASFHEAKSVLQRRFFCGSGTIAFADAKGFSSSAGTVRIQVPGEEAWLKLFSGASEDPVMTELEDWFAQWRVQDDSDPELVRDELLHLLYGWNKALEGRGTPYYALPEYEGRYPFDVIRNGETLEEIRGWLTGWIRKSAAIVRESANVKYRPEIQKVLDMIHDEYATQLKVSDMAKRVGFAENYLSVLFRKETGSKIVDYLTSVRMEKARELLKDPAYKIYEISEMVGYGDSNHFSKYFKKIEGVFPLEYRKMHFR